MNMVMIIMVIMMRVLCAVKYRSNLNIPFFIQGVIPMDVQVLPGQRRAVLEAVKHLRETPPPVSSSTMRPKINLRPEDTR